MILDLTYGSGAMARELNIDPDIKNVFPHGGGFTWRSIPYGDNTFDLILFDPPHIVLKMKNLGAKGKLYMNLADKYGYYETSSEAKEAIGAAFPEILRTLKPNGVCIFKWCDIRMAQSTIEKLILPDLVPFKHEIQTNGGKRVGKYTTVLYYLKKFAKGEGPE